MLGPGIQKRKNHHVLLKIAILVNIFQYFVWLDTDSYNGNQLQRAKVGPSLSYSSVKFSIKSIKTNWFSLLVGGIEVIMNEQGSQISTS